jgi:hypothetical protein
MGAIWMPSIALYGRAAVLMGDLGSSAGWGLYMGVVILVSNFWGFVTGEWRGISGKPIKLIVTGIALLLAAICIIGYATTLKTDDAPAEPASDSNVVWNSPSADYITFAPSGPKNGIALSNCMPPAKQPYR